MTSARDSVPLISPAASPGCGHDLSSSLTEFPLSPLNVERSFVVFELTKCCDAVKALRADGPEEGLMITVLLRKMPGVSSRQQVDVSISSVQTCTDGAALRVRGSVCTTMERFIHSTASNRTSR